MVSTTYRTFSYQKKYTPQKSCPLNTMFNRTFPDFLCDECLELFGLIVVGFHVEHSVHTLLSFLKLLHKRRKQQVHVHMTLLEIEIAITFDCVGL